MPALDLKPDDRHAIIGRRRDQAEAAAELMRQIGDTAMRPSLILEDGAKFEDTRPDTQDLIREVCDGIRDFLVEKNEQYGDSAINPVRIFSKAEPHEQLLVRMDDKLSRLARGDDRLESDDDVLDDLIGYLILYKVAKQKAGA